MPTGFKYFDIQIFNYSSTCKALKSLHQAILHPCLSVCVMCLYMDVFILCIQKCVYYHVTLLKMV